MAQFKTARCILRAQSRYLLVVHNSYFWRAPTAKRWGLPGGRLERNESPREAALRELVEELNVFVPELHAVGMYPYKDAMHMIYGADVPADAYAARNIEFDDTEITEVRWFSRDEVTGLALHAGFEAQAIDDWEAATPGRRAEKPRR